MKKVGMAIGAALVLAAAVAQAGASSNIVVTTGANYAWGSVRDVRHSADPGEYIYCYARSWTTSEQGVCYARDTAGTFKMCVTSDPEQISTIRSINPASYVYFTLESSNCGFISVSNGSTYLD